MTERQKRFADEYIIDTNAIRAYKAAYPTVKKDEAAKANAYRLLSYATVRTYIDERLAEIKSAKIADATEVMEYLTGVVRGETEAEIVVVEGVGEGASEARRVKKHPDEKERLKAAELLGKRYGIFTDKLNVDGALQVVFTGDRDVED